MGFDIVEEVMRYFVGALSWICRQIGLGIGNGINKIFMGAVRHSNVRHVKNNPQLAKTKQDEAKRIADCRGVVLEYAHLYGHIARDCMSRDELEEKIDNGITGEELRAELNDRINRMPGIVLGENLYNPGLRIKQPYTQRARHTYIIGKSGYGKTNLIRAMLMQDIYMGNGVGVIAPEQELLTHEILPYIPPERIEDVVYVNPGDKEYPIPLNPLYADETEDANQKVEDMVTIFKRIVGETGARMDHILNNTLYALVERKNATLLDVSRLLTDASFQQEIIRTTKDPQTREFFQHEYPEYQRGAYLPITTRLGMLTRREPIRNLLCQPGQSFNFRKAMDEGKILLFNLSDGLLGQQAAQILGQLIVSKIQLATMSRANIPPAARRPFYLYLDEFQAYSTANADSYQAILSRARKYKLGLILANQETHQLSDDLLHAILGNVSTLIGFNLSRSDADKLAREYVVVDGDEMLEMPSQEFFRLQTGEAWGKIGKSVFPLKTFLVDQKPDHRRAEYIIEQSRRNYGFGKWPNNPPPDFQALPPHDDFLNDDNDEPPDPSKVF